MRWAHEHSPGWVFVTRMIGIISFLIIIVLANILKSIYPASAPIVGFLNDNFWLLLIIAIILFIADIFSAFPFPLDLPTPIIRAFGSVFIIAFLLAVVKSLTVSSDINNLFQVLSILVAPIVFLLVLATGYYEILRRLFRSGRANGSASATPDPMIGTPRPAQVENGSKSWEDVGTEFRMMIYDIIHRFRQEIRSNKK
ncbi:MAG: hypothetical protein A4E35_00303 [Methanoregula sp. PtaU1.Bin051]|nr:MAG: hypothetical protein A4E35_00303 [Methanoregula sp. PtaU1.Bin051]